MLSKDDLLAELVLERFGPRPLPAATPPHAVQRALTDRAAAPAPPPPERVRRRGHLVVLPGGARGAAA